MALRLQKPQAYKHDFDGTLNISSDNETFSVGLFQWLPKANGKGLKRGKVKVRVRSYATTYGRQLVLYVASWLCLRLDEGWQPEKKEYRLM